MWTPDAMKSPILFALTLAPVIALSACARTPEPSSQPRADASRAPKAIPAIPSEAPAAVVPAAEPPLAVVHKSPTCGCCGLWVEHLQKAGFRVEVRNADNVNAVKERLGVPYGKGSCHTAEIGGYFVEGHVPAEDIKRLLAEKPNAKGLVLPGMPLGSPGMEVPSGEVQPYTVELVQRDGSTVAYAGHGH
jgi:hypothetical protein